MALSTKASTDFSFLGEGVSKRRLLLIGTNETHDNNNFIYDLQKKKTDEKNGYS